MFTGEHDRILYQFDQNEQEDEDGQDLGALIKRGNKKTDLKEVHRLGHFLKNLVNQAWVVPKDSFLYDFKQSLGLNLDQNLNWSKNTSLESY